MKFYQTQMITLKWRALVFVAVTVIVSTWLYNYDQAGLRTKLWPPPSFLGSTWYGPFLFLLIPISLGWLSLGARRRSAKIVGLIFTVFVLLFCLLEIYVGKSLVGPLPWG